MKPTASSRSLTNGASHSARGVVASPLAASSSSSSSSSSRMSPSGKKSRRSNGAASDKPPVNTDGYSYAGDAPSLNAMASSHDLLFQLQQLQHHQQQQQQLHHQHSMAAFGYPGSAVGMQPMQPMQPVIPTGYAPYMGAMPPQRMANATMSMVSSSDQFRSPASGPAATESGEDLVDRIEKKDQMIAQLGSFLTQMKQESEGTAHAWKEKMQEIAELKRQVAALSQQLKDSQEKERQTAEQLAQVTEDVELAVHGLKESETKHLEELKIMNDEIQRRQNEQDQTKTGYEEKLSVLTVELRGCQANLHDATTRCEDLENAMQKMENGHRLVVDRLEEQAQESNNRLQQARVQVETVDKEKQELAQHLWNVTQALDQTTNQERSLQTRVEESAKEMEESRSAWGDRFQQMQNAISELQNLRSALEAEVQSLGERVQDERSQKEQINELMGQEMQRIGQEIHQIHQTYASKLEQHEVEIEHWKGEATILQEKLVRVEGLYVVTRKELDEWQARASQIDEENQILQKNGSEKAYTLQEINEQLRQTLGELHDSRQRFDQLRQRCEFLDASAVKCLQVLPNKQGEDEDAVFPESVIKALEEWKQQAGMMEQIKVSMLRLQQDRDSERERFRQREQELTQKALNIQADLDSARVDATTLAKEVQELTERLGGNETKLTSQVQQLTKELDECRSSSGLQILQLQKSLESHKARVQQLDADKRELLREAENMNASMEGLYQAKNEKQVELDQIKATWKELQAEHADLKESFEDLEANYEHTTSELNQKAKELQGHVQELSTVKERLEREHAGCSDSLTKLRVDFETLNRQYVTDQSKWSDKDRENQRVLEEKVARLDEMMEMLTQLRSRNEFLEQARASDDQTVRMEFDKFQQQLLVLSQEKKRAEMACSNLKTQLDQLMPELFTLKEEKRHWSQAQSDMDAEIAVLKSDVTRLQAEVERLSRARSALQLELNRVTDEGQDVVRQFEVLRRDAKAHERQFLDEHERMRKEIEDLRNESSESSAMVEELQTKMTSVQTAANATINELMSELQNAQDTMGYDKTKFQKEHESLKVQVKTMEEELRRKDVDVKEIQVAFRQEKEQFSEKENELSTKLNRLSAAFETKKQELDRLSKELETKGLKVAEYERKLNPLANARDSLQAKCTELKQALDVKMREAHDLEERYRDDLARAVKEKRDMETMYLSIKEDYDMTRSQSTGQQQQWQSDLRSLKHNLERTKADLMKANAEALSLAQRLETCQVNAQETIAELSTRLQGADQQKEMAVNALQREINLERERRREAEVQKMELQRLLRQRGAAGQVPSTNSSGTANTAIGEETGNWSSTLPTPSSQRSQSWNEPPQQQQSQQQARSFNESPVPQSQPEMAKSVQASAPPPEYRKFYANEPMTNAELANLPMNLIKAQIGLDLAGDYSSKSPAKGGKSAARAGPKLSQFVDNSDDIPMLALEKLPQNPEATDGESSPTCDSGNSSRLVSDKRSGAVSLLDALSSSRSNSDRYLAEIIESSTRPQRNSSSSSLHSNTSNASSGSGSNNKKKPTAKKKRPSVMPSSSSAAASAYSAFSTMSAPSPSPPKMKSNSKLLPRIQQ